MSQEPALAVRNLSKTYVGQRALKEVSMEVLPGEIHALVGQNGCGKSTLVKCLSAYHQPDPGGEIIVAGTTVPIPFGGRDAEKYGMAFVHQDLGIVPSLTVLENFCLGRGFETGPFQKIRWNAEAKRVRKLITEFGHDIDPGAEIRRLPSTDRTIVAIVRALASLGDNAQLLVLDEPTASLPQKEVDFLFDAVRRVARRGVGVLYVSHRLQEIFLLCDRVTVLRDGDKIGTFNVKDLTENDLVELITGRKIGQFYPPQAEDSFGRPTVLEVEGLSGNILDSVSFVARQGEVLGIAGLLGSGCSEVGRLIFGAQPRTAGTIKFEGNGINFARPKEAIKAGIAMLSEDRRSGGMFPGLTVAENMTITDVKRFWSRGIIHARAEREEVAELMKKYTIMPPDPYRRITKMSGGNQQKVMVAKWMRLKPKVLIADEPVVGVDVGSKVDIYRTLQEVAKTGTTVLLMSSEFKDLAQLCDRVLVLRRGQLVGELYGSNLTEDQVARLAYMS